MDNTPLIFNSAKDRYPDFFEVTDFVIKTLHQWIDRTSIPAPQTVLGLVLHACNVRAYNLYRSINNLLETDHWEDAAILSRSMFELVLNLEEIQREKGKEEKRARKYLRFNYLQQFLHKEALVQYNQVTGRSTQTEPERLVRMQKLTCSLFAEFRKPKRTPEWQRSWCDKSVHRLAKDSADPMRCHHYRIIYSFFSDLSHSGPLPVMAQMLLGETQEEVDQLLNAHDDSEKDHMAVVLSLSTIWCLEILRRGSAMIPDYDMCWNFEVMKSLYKAYGVAPPPLRTGRNKGSCQQSNPGDSSKATDGLTGTPDP